MKREYDLKNKVESILFSSGKRVAFEEIINLIRIKDRPGILAALKELQQDYESKNGALMIVEEGEYWKMTVREKYLSIVQRIVADTELSKTVMETLAVIAWKQPILQSEVIAIRTNKAYDHIIQLEEMGFLTLEKHGRSKLIKLSEKFYNYFDVHDDKGLNKLFKDIKIVGQTKMDSFSEEQKLELELKEVTQSQLVEKDNEKIEKDKEVEQESDNLAEKLPVRENAQNIVEDIEAQAQLLGVSMEAQKLESAQEELEEKSPHETSRNKRKEKIKDDSDEIDENEILEGLKKIAKK